MVSATSSDDSCCRLNFLITTVCIMLQLLKMSFSTNTRIRNRILYRSPGGKLLCSQCCEQELRTKEKTIKNKNINKNNSASAANLMINLKSQNGSCYVNYVGCLAVQTTAQHCCLSSSCPKTPETNNIKKPYA